MAEVGAASRWRTTTRALRYRNYQLYFFGQGLSLIGTWMQMIATSWLVYRLTGSAWWLGMSGFISRVPSLVLTPVAGVLVDRWDKQRIVVMTQVASMVQAFMLAGLTLSGHITVVQVIALSAVLGIINAFDVPSRQAFIVELVEDRDDLSNAIALNSSMFNGARLLGPAIAGVLTAKLGEGPCFLINAISYIAVIWALLAMKLPAHVPSTEKAEVLRGLAEGMRYVWGFTPLRSLILLIALVSLMGTPYMVLLPKYVNEVLHRDSQGFGMLMGASGIGALGGALYLAGRRTVAGLERVIPVATTVFAFGLLALAQSHTFWLSWTLMIFTGGAMMVQMASTNTVLQTLVDDDKRGRVMSLYALAFMGTAPFGSLLAQLGDTLGVAGTIQLGGLSALLGAAFFAWRLPAFRALIQPVYIEKGILPAVAEGLQSSSDLLSED